MTHGVMVALFPDQDLAQHLALDMDGAIDQDKLHLTLAFLGDVDQVENLDKLPAVVAYWAERQPPVEGTIGGVGLFNKANEEGARPFYASFDSHTIQRARADLVDHLEANGYRVNKEHAFNSPHITLAYTDELPQIEPVDLEVRFDEISLCVGDVRYDYPFSGSGSGAQEIIRQEDGEWFLYSHDGRKLGGPYRDRSGAEDREKQVQFFKHQSNEGETLDLSQYSKQDRDLALALVAFGEKNSVTPEGLDRAGEFVDHGLGYWTNNEGLALTVTGRRAAGQWLREFEGGIMPTTATDVLTAERDKWEIESELWPVRESGGQELTGKAWDVTLIGATNPSEVVSRGGREYIKSRNGRLYSCQALAESVDQWNGVKVYDNHLTDDEFKKRQGMRSVAKEWIGTIVSPYWDRKRRQLRGTLKVVDDALANKLFQAHQQGVLSTIGLSIDTLPDMRGGFHEGQTWSFIDGFNRIYSVDLVAEPAAGGGFNRLIASATDGNRNRTVSGQHPVIDAGGLIEWINTAGMEQVKQVVTPMVREALWRALRENGGRGRLVGSAG